MSDLQTEHESQETVHVSHLLWKAMAGLAAFDVLGLGRDFAKMRQFVKKFKRAQCRPAPNVAELVCNAVNRACVWYPKRVLCLQRSAVTTCLLRLYGVPARMVMGAQSTPFQAHAWTEVDGSVVNERREVEKVYAVLERI